MDRSKTPQLPTTVEEGVSKFRVGEDFALAHRLQGEFYRIADISSSRSLLMEFIQSKSSLDS